MFELYNEAARRVIFFAWYETGEFGAPEIATEHLLLGLLVQDKALLDRIAGAPVDAEAIRRQVIAHTPPGETVSTEVDIPLNFGGKRALMFAADESKRLNHQHIGTEHLLLGLLAEDGCFAAEILRGLGLRLEKVREDLAKRPSGI